jgi:hypothetical protein
MIRNKINFITGETYTLSELFSGERKIIIPDLQRDYCWGDAVHTNEKKELVTDFVKTLISLYEKKDASRLNLGLIYGYESPANRIQLCDGQQRITTLFLLLGMLNKYSQNNFFRQYLISDFEYKHDDREPYLNYAIRESSLYFMSDLVCHFFITDDAKYKNYYIKDISQINQSINPWYYTEYDFDPTIQSMIKALSVIGNILQAHPQEWIVSFGDFLIHRLTFMYYDMENRRNGEETFVVINTTGEPLSATQNLKPLVMKAKVNENFKPKMIDGRVVSLPQAWEMMENWFWQNRIEDNGNDTADAGFSEFLRWVSIIHIFIQDNSPKEDARKNILAKGKYKFDYESISFEEIWQYWLAVKRVFELKDFFDKDFLSPKEEDFGETKIRALRQIDCFRLLPVIEYCKIRNCGWDNRGTVRLYQFVNNLSRLDNITKNINVLVEEVIKIANKCEDVVDILILEKISSTILTEEEKKKLCILDENKGNETLRKEIEDAFWKAQEHPVLKGEIMSLLQWSCDNNQFVLSRFKNNYDHFNRVFNSNIKDITRRSLLTLKLEEYPYYYKGLTFGDSSDEWKTIITKNKDKIKEFLDTLFELGNDITDEQLLQSQKNLCDSFMDVNYQYYDFIKHGYLLDYCNHKRINQWGDEWKLCKSLWSRPFSIKNAKLLYYLEGNWNCTQLDCGKTIDEENLWKLWFCQEQDCVVIESSELGIAIDIVSKQDDSYYISVFRRKNNDTETKLKFLEELSDDGLIFREERYRIEKKYSIEECMDYLRNTLIRQINEKYKNLPSE